MEVDLSMAVRDADCRRADVVLAGNPADKGLGHTDPFMGIGLARGSLEPVGQILQTDDFAGHDAKLPSGLPTCFSPPFEWGSPKRSIRDITHLHTP